MRSTRSASQSWASSAWSSRFSSVGNWVGLDRRGWLIAAALCVFAFRATFSLLQGFTYIHGFNEAWYTEVSHGLAVGDHWHPRWFERPYYDTPPLTMYLIVAAHALLGQAEGVSRVPSLAAWLTVLSLTYKLGQRRYGDGPARMLLMACTPFVFFWMGRAQTDPILAACVVWLAWLNERGDRRAAAWAGVAVFLGLMAKQTFVFAAPLVLLWPRPHRLRAVVSGAVGGLGAAAWWAWQYHDVPEGVLYSVRYHLFQRAKPFHAVPEMAFIGLLLGGAVVMVLLAFNERGWRDGAWWSMALFCLFPLWNGPNGHAYYVLPGVVLAVVCAPPWRHWWPWARKTFVIAAPALCIFFLVDGGDLGPPILKSEILAAPAGTCIANEWWPQARYYRPEMPHCGWGCRGEGGSWTICGASFDRARCAVVTDRAWDFTHIYTLRCEPDNGTTLPFPGSV